MRKIKLLLRPELCNTFGENVARFSRDRKKKRTTILMMAVYALLGLMLAGYAGSIAYGYIYSGLAAIVPAYLMTVVSIAILLFTIFKAGWVLFDRQSYERLVPLPVRPADMIAAKLLKLYLSNLALSAVVLLPGLVVYAAMLQPQLHFYPMALAGILLLPLLPVTISTALSAGIMILTARFRHKNALTILLTLALMAAIFALSGTVSRMEEAEFTSQLIAFSEMIFSAITALYPPAGWFSNGILNGDWGAYALFAAVSVGVFALLIAVVQRFFVQICSRLSSTAATHSYKMQAQGSRTLLRALFHKERTRYFASSLYVLNTAIGGLMMIVIACVISFGDLSTVELSLGIPGIIVMLTPSVLSMAAALMPTTSSAISIEGRQWWQMQSLPVRTKDVFDAKLLVNLMVTLPCWVVSMIVMVLFQEMHAAELLSLLLLPLSAILLSSNAALAINCRLPLLSWESEASVVKQSGAAGLSMLAGFLIGMIPAVLHFALPVPVGRYSDLLISALYLAVSWVLYRQNAKIELKMIG